MFFPIVVFPDILIWDISFVSLFIVTSSPIVQNGPTSTVESNLDFFETEYDEEFDLFLYKEVGYDALRLLVVDLFTAAYSATSLREYFARGFEEYYLGNLLYLKDISPYIYKKLSLLNEKDLEELDYNDRL